MKRIRTLMLTLVALAATACRRDTLPADAFVVRDSAGVTIVENREPMLPPGSWTIELDPDVVIGDDESSETEILFRVEGALVLSDDRIVVAQAADPILRWFSPEGVYLSGWGRHGEGPSEFDNTLGALWPLTGDSVGTWEHSSRRMKVIDPSGNHVRTVTLALPPDLPPNAYRVVSGRSGHGFVGFLERPSWEVGTLGETQRDELTYIVHDPDGSYVGRLGPLAGFEYITMEVHLPGRSQPIHVRDRPLFAKVATTWLHEDELFYGSADVFEVAVHDLRGGVRRLIRADVPDRPVTGKIRREYLERERSESDGAEPRTSPSLEDRPFPDELPAYRRLRVDRVGRLWVQHYPLPRDATVIWSVFDPSGRWITDIAMPSGWSIQDIGNDYVLAVAQNELGIERLMRFRLSS